MGQSIDQQMNGSWDACLAFPADFAGAVMTSSPTWQKREGLGLRLLKALCDYYWLVCDWS